MAQHVGASEVVGRCALVLQVNRQAQVAVLSVHNRLVAEQAAWHIRVLPPVQRTHLEFRFDGGLRLCHPAVGHSLLTALLLVLPL